jgi:drug/metabolite transporter (DMT)-like permease
MVFSRLLANGDESMRRGVTYGVIAGALWGGVFLAPVLIPDFSAIEGSAGRFAAYGLVSLLIALPRARLLLSKLGSGDLGLLIRLALAGNLVYYFFLSAGVSLVGIAATSLIIGTLPVTITLFGPKSDDAVSLRRLAPPLLTILMGIICINLDVFSKTSSRHTASTPLTGTTAVVGIACGVAALATWTWFAIANSRALKERTQFSGNEWSVVWGVVTGLLSLAIWLVLLLAPAQWTLAWGVTQHTTHDWGRFWAVNLGLAIGASWLGNALWNAASRRLSPTLSGQMIVFETLFALLYGFLYALHWPTPLEVAAIALLLAGVLWSVRLHARAAH